MEPKEHSVEVQNAENIKELADLHFQKKLFTEAFHLYCAAFSTCEKVFGNLKSSDQQSRTKLLDMSSHLKARLDHLAPRLAAEKGNRAFRELVYGEVDDSCESSTTGSTETITPPDSCVEDFKMKEIKRFDLAFYLPKPTTSFSDIVGYEQAKATLSVSTIASSKFSFLFQGSRRICLGTHLLMYGLPGNGKSLLAKALANEAGEAYKYLEVSGSDLLGSLVGHTEKSIDALFEMARKHAPCIVFIDEIDGLFRKRSEAGASSSSVNAVTQFLRNVQDEKMAGVTLLAATNIPTSVDEAILRRFQKLVHVGNPKLKQRKMILIKYLGGDHNLCEEDLHEVAIKTKGYSCADLKRLASDCLEAGILAATTATHFKRVRINWQLPGQEEIRWTACDPHSAGAKPKKLSEFDPELVLVPKVTKLLMMHILSSFMPRISTNTENDGMMKDITEFQKEFDPQVIEEESGIELDADCPTYYRNVWDFGFMNKGRSKEFDEYATKGCRIRYEDKNGITYSRNYKSFDAFSKGFTTEWRKRIEMSKK